MTEAPTTTWTCAGCGVPAPFECNCATDVACSGDVGKRVSKWKREVLVELGLPDPEATILAAATRIDAILGERDD